MASIKAGAEFSSLGRRDFYSREHRSIVKDDCDSLGISGLDCTKIAVKKKSNFALINSLTKLQHSEEQKASEDRKLSALLELKDKIVLPPATLREDKLSLGAI